ncbi:hypothetical protein A6V36_30490 [Paraburkholderia ginsengiterrae]|uniref:Uncharacterized protein n=1 Tax=Paraburkholderia ginsengiterrae TaxID=1462993 RepID=A0A1A9N2E5_9BURK|nr:hypothetical protein [Paraburkholderia ginsengiterrae]OAJ55968.1 hypothetical protein A6V37_32130 [Paraburkholderia ginsengiterrae]OAJ58573.1 hypothetical protein A6V36_30490 [Paraburkholderia ginsengiterrae]
MNGWDAVFFPPSKRYAHEMALRLRMIAGARRLSRIRARNVFAQLCGYGDWDDLDDNLMNDRITVTVWDDELDPDTFSERMDMQIGPVVAALHISVNRAMAILDALQPSRRQHAPTNDGLDDFCAKFDEWLVHTRPLSVFPTSRKLPRTAAQLREMVRDCPTLYRKAPKPSGTARKRF